MYGNVCGNVRVRVCLRDVTNVLIALIIEQDLIGDDSNLY